MPAPPVEPIPFGSGLRAAPEPIEVSTPFALMVSTIEVRKNHLLVLQIWDRLVATHGADRVPNLIFVGKLGWSVTPLLARLAATNALHGKVRIMSGLRDGQVRSLYRACELCIQASFVEGWGLSVTEALSEGAFCVVSDGGALPEAGGTFVDYFDPTDFESAYRTVERALFEPGYLTGRRAEIRAGFRASRNDTVAALVSQVGRLRTAAPA